MTVGKSIDNHARFDFVRYANCWEDADILVEALQPAPGKRFVSIASAGDNTLSLLTGAPERVVAVDLNRVQLACLELRCVAIAKLDDDALLAFLGVQESIGHRIDTYKTKLRADLSTIARDIWDSRLSDIERGIIHCGKFENYFRLFRQYALPLVHDRKKVKRLLASRGTEAAREFYETAWNTWQWQIMFRLFFSRAVMGGAGRDKAFFRYAEGSVANRILDRTSYALTEIDTGTNPYLGYILTGNFRHALPHYLREENLKAIRRNMGALEIFHGTTDTLFEQDASTFDGFNLSDIFEYMDEDLFIRTTENIISNSKPNARIAYWNMLVPRSAEKLFPDNIQHLESLSNQLFAQDKARFYHRFLVDEITHTWVSHAR